MKKRLVLPGAALVAIALSGSASATSEDARWAGWIGCWRADAAPAGEVLCVVPDGDGVRMVTISGGKILGEVSVFADAQSRPVSEEGCEGTESAHWSTDGYRVFTRSELTCSNVRRGMTGIMAMITPKEWVNVQAIAFGDNPDHVLSRTVRYTATDLAGVPEEIAALAQPKAMARETARWASTEPLDLDDLREALRTVDHRAVQALVLARSQPFDLDAKTIVALDAEGVPGTVIDAMVAVSHPEHFAVVPEPAAPNFLASEDRYDTGRAYASQVCSSWGSAYNPWLDPFASPDLCRGYSYLGMSRYGYNFGRYGGYGWGYGYTPVIVVRNPNPSTEPSEEVRRGTVSRSGYHAGTSSSGSARARGRERPSSSVNSTGSMSGSRATTSSTGSSARSGSSSSGEKAKPRGSGG